MPTFAAVSSTVTFSPSVLAQGLNAYLNKTLIPQGYKQKAFVGLMWGEKESDAGLTGRPAVPIPSHRMPQRKTGEGDRAELILNFENGGNMQSFYDLQELETGIWQGGTKIATPWAHYTTFTAMARTQKVENSGGSKQFDILKSMLEQKTRDAFNTLETDALGANTDTLHTTGQDSLVGLQHWNAASSTSGLVHTLDRSVYTTFRNQKATSSGFAANGLDTMETMFYATSGTNGNQPVDLIGMHTTPHGYYTKQAMAVHRLVGDLSGVDLAVKGTVYYRGIPCLHSSEWPTGRQDWLSTQQLYTFILNECNWAEEEPGLPSNRAYAFLRRWYFTAALMHARPEQNGVLVISGA